jgi:hypothetical protein
MRSGGQDVRDPATIAFIASPLSLLPAKGFPILPDLSVQTCGSAR